MAREITIRDFMLAVAHYRLAHGDPLAVVSAAANLVGKGLGGPDLIDLAGSHRDDVAVFDEQIDGSFEELGLEAPTTADFANWLTQEIARRIVGNEIEPVEGARQIKRMVAVTVSEDGPWRSFAGLVDEWEETTAEKTGYVDDIRALALSVAGTVQ